MGYMETMGERLRAERESAGLTQSDLADSAGVTKQAIFKIEAGLTASPGASTLDPICRRLGVSARWLMTGKGEKQWAAAKATHEDWGDVRAYSQSAGLGKGAEADEYAESHKLKFRASSLARKRLNPDALAVFYGRGDSMLPRIHDGDAVMFDTKDTRPRDGCIFIVMWKGEYYAKRCEVLDDLVFFKADNPNGDHGWNKPKRMDAKRDPVEIIGRVRWIGSWED